MARFMRASRVVASESVEVPMREATSVDLTGPGPSSAMARRQARSRALVRVARIWKKPSSNSAQVS